MEICFTPSPDVAALLNALLDRFENRARQAGAPEARGGQPEGRPVKISLSAIDLPGYFSQADPEPRLAANQQLQELARHNLVSLDWSPGQSGHLLEAIGLRGVAALYRLIEREPLAERRAGLETLLLAERFRFPAGDWRSQAAGRILAQVRAGKSPAPFRLADPGWNQDLLAVLAALPNLETETPFRVFSVRVFNDSKRFEALKPALVRLARLGSPAWRRLSADELLRELNLAANPGYLPFSGPWQILPTGGEVLPLGGFTPSVGFPAAQTGSIQSVAVHAPGVLCIENLTTFHAFSRQAHPPAGQFAALCSLGNPSPAVRRVLRLLPEAVPLYLWADLDYGGFNILGQMRQLVHPRVQPYCMDIATFEAHARLARPLAPGDERSLQRLADRPDLQDVRPVILYLLAHGLKLEQEAID